MTHCYKCDKENEVDLNTPLTAEERAYASARADELVNELFDPRKTYLDMTPPRFDVSGNKITGEFDEIKTPELIEVRLEDIEEAPLMPWFLIGVAIGAIAFLAAFVLLTIKGA